MTKSLVLLRTTSELLQPKKSTLQKFSGFNFNWKITLTLNSINLTRAILLSSQILRSSAEEVYK